MEFRKQLTGRKIHFDMTADFSSKLIFYEPWSVHLTNFLFLKMVQFSGGKATALVFGLPLTN